MNFFKKNLFFILTIIIILIYIAFRFAEPIADGDYFFHLAYGKYFLENKTIIPDHSIYSWIPVNKSEIYCAWTGEILFYLLHRLTGLTGIFVIRYLCVLATVILILLYAIKLKRHKNPLIWLYIVIFILSSYSGTYHKPELFSFLFINLLVFLYFTLKLSINSGKENYRILYLFPIIMLVWVNTHGVFLFAMIFLFLSLLGEVINYYFFSENLMAESSGKKTEENKNEIEPKDKHKSSLLLKHLAINFLLSGICLFITPYSYHYILNLLTDIFTKKRALDQAFNMAYVSPLKDTSSPNHTIEIFVFMCAVLLFTLIYSAVKEKKVDFSIILTNVFFCYLFTKFGRTTYLWPPVCIYSILYLQKDYLWPEKIKKLRIVFQTAVILYFLFFSLRGIYECYNQPFLYRWPGFGICYQNPVAETEFLKKYKPGITLFNDYDTGAYLMWELYPEYKVSLDARAFPYIGFYPDYARFIYGIEFDTFIEKYPFDVAMIGLRYQQCVLNFLASPSWKPVFYGPTAVIFVKKDLELPEEVENFMPDRFKDLKSIDKLVEVYAFLNMRKDYETASELLDTGRNNFSSPRQKKLLEGLGVYREATVAWQVDNDYEKAIFLYEKCKDRGVFVNDAILTRLYRWKSLVMASRGRYKEALVYEKAIGADNPYDTSAVYNAGTLLLLLKLQGEKTELDFRPFFEEFLRRAPEHIYAVNVKKVLDGEAPQDFQLLTYPSQPDFRPLIDGF